MMFKILFLDIDGVMNHRAQLRRAGRLDTMGSDHAEVLNMIFDAQPDLYVVISSSWRYHFPFDDLKMRLGEAGFRYVDRIIGRTRDDAYDEVTGSLQVSSADPRGHQIRDWLYEYGQDVNGLVILDDDTDMEPLKGFLVQTTFELGLTTKHVPGIMRKLSREWKWEPRVIVPTVQKSKGPSYGSIEASDGSSFHAPSPCKGDSTSPTP
jgi:hypothetical protein